MMPKTKDAHLLNRAKVVAKDYGCFVVEKFEVCKKTGEQKRVYLLYREGTPKNEYLAKRTRIGALWNVVARVTGFK